MNLTPGNSLTNIVRFLILPAASAPAGLGDCRRTITTVRLGRQLRSTSVSLVNSPASVPLADTQYAYDPTTLSLAQETITNIMAIHKNVDESPGNMSSSGRTDSFPMPFPRSLLIPNGADCLVHTISRCVRRAWLCGDDPYSGKNFDHRRVA